MTEEAFQEPSQDELKNINIRPTGSLLTIQQRQGRSLRLDEGADKRKARIINILDNIEEVTSSDKNETAQSEKENDSIKPPYLRFMRDDLTI